LHIRYSISGCDKHQILDGQSAGKPC
jgi:hypothetical protein